MKTKLLFLLIVIAFARLTGQNYYKIVFAGNPESVFVENLTQAKSVSLPGTDTLHLKLKGTSVGETESAQHKLTFYPNPMDQSCSFDFYNQKPGRVIIQVFNANGSLIHKYSNKLPQGIQHFQLSGVASGVYVIDIKTGTRHYSGSFVSTDKSNTAFLLMNKSDSPQDTGKDKKSNTYNNTDIGNTPLDYRNSVELDFATGDQLKFTGYKTGSDDDIEYASPTGDQTIAFTFCVRPYQPVSGTHNPSQTQIEWNWKTAAEATGYKYNTVNNYATATDNGSSTTYTQTGLTCNTAYTLYIWAYNGCGNSTSVQLSQTTSACASGCGSPVTFTYNGSTVTYGTVTSANNRCWLDRNHGCYAGSYQQHRCGLLWTSIPVGQTG